MNVRTARRMAAYVVCPLVLLASSAHGPARPAALSPATIVVKNVVLGKTPAYTGATEAAGFFIADLVDLGIDAYKLWTDMSEFEWADDDDLADDGTVNGSSYGSPSIAAIKADASNGFANRVPWAWWDARFTGAQNWRFGTQSRKGILDALKANDIMPVVMLRTYNPAGYPEKRPEAPWAPRPPYDDNFRNEWWEHCFAVAYWLNVRNNYGITHFQILNEPNYYECPKPTECRGQGWIGSQAAYYGGTEWDYVKLVRDAHDAVSYANSFAGLPTRIHAPVVSQYSSSYMTTALDSADAEIDVVDYHTFNPSPKNTVTNVKNAIATHNPDGVTEPIFVSEFGAVGSTGTLYKTLNRAITTADQYIGLTLGGVEGLTINNMYDWTTYPTDNRGLVDLQGDGVTLTGRVKTQTYFAYRLLIRAMSKAKDRMKFAQTGLTADQAIVTRDASALYVLVKNANNAVDVDVSAVPGYGGTATVYEYSATREDEIVASVPVVGGKFSISAGDSSLVLAKIPASASQTCGGKTPTLTGTDVADVLTGTAGADVILGLGGNDGIQGLGGNDVICGGPGDDTLEGGDGSDKIYGEGGADFLSGGKGKDTLDGGDGGDTLKGDQGDDILSGGPGSDSCDGGKHIAGDSADGTCEIITNVP